MDGYRDEILKGISEKNFGKNKAGKCILGMAYFMPRIKILKFSEAEVFA